MRGKSTLILVVIYIGMGIFLFGGLKDSSIQEIVDMVAVNEIVKEVELCKGQWADLAQFSFAYDFNIVNEEEEILYQSGTYEESSMQRAKAHHNLCEQVGNLGVIIHTANEQQLLKQENRLRIWMLGIYLLLGVFMLIERRFIWKYYFKPFKEMEGFAHQIANGNLDIPLKRDKANLFGAFTESFDIMREELKRAREREYAANISKKELVASLSHDIKTPVTSIKLISEVLLVKVAEDEVLCKKIAAIYGHCEKIDALVSNLFESTLQELGEITVIPKEEYASSLIDMIKLADYKERVTISGQPEGIILIDPLPMQQVITNIIANSYKYADTVMTATFYLEEEYLNIAFKDFGKGIPEEEIHLVFQKFYRGKQKAVQEKAGAGLGMYLCKYYMEKMAGQISCYNEEDGFAVLVQIKLSC